MWKLTPYAEVEVMKMCMPLLLPAFGIIHFKISDGQLLLVSKKITNARDLIAVLEEAIRGGYLILIIDEDIEQEALATLVVNKLRGALKIAALKDPDLENAKASISMTLPFLLEVALILIVCSLMGFMFLYGSHDRKMRQGYITNDDDYLNKSCFNNGDLKLEKMGTDDIVVGAVVPGTALAHTLGKVPPQLYDSFIVTIDNGSITIMQNKSMPADPHPIPGALLMGDAFNMRHPLTGGGMTRTPEILLHLGKVGAQIETELKEKKLRVEDVLNATKAPVEEGNVVGGGCTLLRLAAKVDAIKLTLDNDEQKVLHDTFQVGADIVKKVLSYPLKLIAKNVSDSGSVVMEMVFSSDNFKYGYNAATGKYEDLMVVGIINPTKKIGSHDDKGLLVIFG
ncbi:hypothetical protein GIB67_038828 [Kingdonia uniflora]|uniref:Squalene epoxidase domain-containing protein n=1 Tax=Kingdonia uniflora TaxID=39325 RepID=A0A7J7M0S2_9MAGN|nr:hypothetical protein GIB67_038828 [Kingdonia uniflora]